MGLAIILGFAVQRQQAIVLPNLPVAVAVTEDRYEGKADRDVDLDIDDEAAGFMAQVDQVAAYRTAGPSDVKSEAAAIRSGSQCK